MRFGSPLFFWLLLLVPLTVVFLMYAAHRRKSALKRFAQVEMLGKLMSKISPWRRLVRHILLVLTVFFAVLALVRPQFGTRMELMKRKGLDVVIAVDVSLSMYAQDIQPNRLARAKHEIGRFVDALNGDRVGLVAFAGDAFIQCPLTLDYGATKMFLDILGPSLVSTPGTSLGEAIRVSLQAFDPKQRKYKVIVLLTDGEDHTGKFESWVNEAVSQGVKIYTVGIGSLQGVPIPLNSPDGSVSYKKDRDGNIVTTRLDEVALQKAALATGGQYYHASPGAFELGKVVAQINQMEKRELEAERFVQYEERYQIPLALSIICFIALMLLPEKRKTGGTWKGRFT